ncbi:hypothetical protein Micbo1qcDRAFT_193917 [Microdochium bolleyi]|uniref:PPPDE domain-containing protein n=1 Tax=Microdochium bolleyi TaxID=196109 RepID=A0A136JCH0_9PEZI|nr:hypothetical protein Micbo1qcDRAFT_193917 [Microdochium bolleyi]
MTKEKKLRSKGFDFNVVGTLNKAAEAADSLVKKAWDVKNRRDAAKEAEAAAEEDRRLVAERNAFLQTITAKLTGVTTSEVPPLVVDRTTTHRAVLFVTTPIAFGPVEVSRSSYKLLARHVGMSMTSVSHWALCVIDRGLSGKCWAYDLMSDQMALTMLGKNYFRVYEVTPEFIATWNSCSYVGETTKPHEEIQELGHKHMTSNPRYHLLENNCQHLVEALVAELCNGAHVEQAKLSEELEHVSPRIAMDLMAARLHSRMDVKNEKEDSEGVKEDVDVLKSLLKLYEKSSRKKHGKDTPEAIENGDTPLAIENGTAPLAIMPAPPHESALSGTDQGVSTPALLYPPPETAPGQVAPPPADRSAPTLLHASPYGELSPPLPARPPSSQGAPPNPAFASGDTSPALLAPFPAGELSPPLPMRPSSSRGLSPGPGRDSGEASPALPPRPSSSMGNHPATPPYFPPPPNGAG